METPHIGYRLISSIINTKFLHKLLGDGIHERIKRILNKNQQFFF